MTTELYWLTLTALMTALFWVPYVLNRVAMTGLGGTLAGGAPDSGSAFDLGAARHQGALPMRWRISRSSRRSCSPRMCSAFRTAPPRPPSSSTSSPASLHFVVYTAAIPAARTLTFTAGWLAQVAIIASILRWI